MKKRSGELLASVSTMVALAVGATACGGTTQAEHTQPKIFHIETSNPYSPKIEQAASQIIRLAGQSPSRFVGKPPYSIGFTVPTREGGKILYSVQTATPEHDASETEQITVEQTGPNEANFALSLDAMNDGTWDTFCDTNPFSAGNYDVREEVRQKFIERSGQLNGKPYDDRKPDNVAANDLLGIEVSNLATLVGVAATEGPISASNNICSVTLAG